MAQTPVKSRKGIGGRPTTYNPEIAAYVCDIISTHPHVLNKLNRMYAEFPDATTIYAWMHAHPQFSQQYLEARKAQATVLADSMLDVADTIPVYHDEKGNERIDAGMLGRAKLEYETRKWHASKMAPKIYGDKQIIEQTTSENESLKAELSALRAQLAEKNKSDY